MKVVFFEGTPDEINQTLFRLVKTPRSSEPEPRLQESIRPHKLRGPSSRPLKRRGSDSPGRPPAKKLFWPAVMGPDVEPEVEPSWLQQDEPDMVEEYLDDSLHGDGEQATPTTSRSASSFQLQQLDRLDGVIKRNEAIIDKDVVGAARFRPYQRNMTEEDSNRIYLRNRTCSECGHKFQSFREFIGHECTSTYKCTAEHCVFSGRTQHGLNVHFGKTHKKTQKEFQTGRLGFFDYDHALEDVTSIIDLSTYLKTGAAEALSPTAIRDVTGSDEERFPPSDEESFPPSDEERFPPPLWNRDGGRGGAGK